MCANKIGECIFGKGVAASYVNVCDILHIKPGSK